MPKLLTPGIVNPCHELLKRRLMASGLLATEAPRSARSNSQRLPRRTCPWIFWLHLWPGPGTLRRSSAVCSRHADVTWG